jgi:hypothetical protein
MMKDKLIQYVTLAALILFVAFYFYRMGKQDEKFKEQLKEIQNVRKALADSVESIQKRTQVRDEELRGVIKRELEIIDTLNVTLKRLNNSSKAIETKIEENKKTIDDLWDLND